MNKGTINYSLNNRIKITNSKSVKNFTADSVVSDIKSVIKFLNFTGKDNRLIEINLINDSIIGNDRVIEVEMVNFSDFNFNKVLLEPDQSKLMLWIKFWTRLTYIGYILV